MISKTASFFSYLFHPIFFTLAGILIIFNTDLYITVIPVAFKTFIYSAIFLCTVLIPLTIIPALYLYKSIKNISMNEKRERIVPLFFTAISFYLAFYIVSRYSSIRIIDIFLLASFSVLVVLLIITLFWKVSLHMSGLGGLTGLVLMISAIYSIDMTWYLAAVLLISGVVASARLALNAHSMAQILSGYFIGLLIVCFFLLQLLPGQ